MAKILIGISGASGAIYGRMVVEKLLAEGVEVGMVFSKNGLEVACHEGIVFPSEREGLTVFDNDDMFAPPASGSAGWDAMAIVPCSMGTAARVATGVSDTLLTRAADVMLKERRPLVVVPREMPLGTLHLRNLLTLSELGAVVIPASPSFYSLPANTEEFLGTVVEKIVAHLGINVPHFRWGE